MKSTFAFLLISILLLIPGMVPAQAQDIELDLQLTNSHAQIFYVGDLDVRGIGNAPEIFRLTITNNTPDTKEIKIYFKMVLNNTLLVEASSNRFLLPPGSFTFTNNQLNTGQAFIENNNIELKDYSVNWDRVENLQSQVLTTGKLPSGQYQFNMEYVEYTNGVPGQPQGDMNPGNNILTITNPTTLEPIYPGNRVNEGNLIDIPSSFPYFQWQSDAFKFNLFVYEKYPEDQSIQDVLSKDPVLHIEGYPNQVFQYPTDPSQLTFYDRQGNPIGGSVGPIRMLEPGNIYYWYVQAVITTSSQTGEETLNSDVYQFQIADQDQAGTTSEMINTYLRQLLGDKFEQYSQALQGYQPTGNLLLNNVPIEIETLVELINKMNNDKIEIQNITIE